MKIDLRNKQAADFYATTYCYEEKRNLSYHKCINVRSPVIIFSISSWRTATSESVNAQT